MTKCKHCGQEIHKKKCRNMNLAQFFEAVERQFVYGGQKYAHSTEKESTDLLFDDFGKSWLFGTLAKYCMRFKNVAREKDTLKIATYCFILWLKRGFHLKEEGSYDVIDTTVDIKQKYFSKFIERAKEYMEETVLINIDNPIDRIYQALKEASDGIFCLLKEDRFLEIFYVAYYVWNKEIKEKGKDEDVFNETKKEIVKK